MKQEEFNNNDFVFVTDIRNDEPTRPYKPEPSKLLTYPVAVGLATLLYTVYINVFLDLRDLSSYDPFTWHYHIAGSGLTAGMAFYLLFFWITWRFLRPLNLCRFIQRHVEETLSFYMECWDRYQRLRSWNRRTARMKES